MSENPLKSNNFNLIRLIAAAQVIAVHAMNHLGFEGPLVTAMKAVPGVPTFFFISGLLIYTSYSRTIKNGLMAFFKNRSLRIYPALWVCTAFSMIAITLTGYLKDQDFSLIHFSLWNIGQISFFQFYNPNFMREFGVGVLNGALWTISVELQFYILSPILFFLMTKNKILFFVFVLLSLITNIMIINLSNDSIYLKLVYVSFLPWIYMFALGFIIAHNGDLRQFLQENLRIRWLAPLYIISMIFIGCYEVNANNAINPISFILLACCLLRISVIRLPIPDRVSRFVAREDFSYGLYLYHMPVMNTLLFVGWFSAKGNVLAVFAGTAVLAILSWYFVEKPMLKHKQ